MRELEQARTESQHAKRQLLATVSALALTGFVGSAMASDQHLWSSGTLHAKLALVVVAILLVVVHARQPGKHVYEGLIFLVSLVIVGLGLHLATM